MGPNLSQRTTPNRIRTMPEHLKRAPDQTRDDELDEHESKEEPSESLAIADVPSLPSSASDIWKGQARDREATPPKTPPRVHALPVETSPWAEGRA
ncbi:hypothetical protein AG1IA_10479 [Rhizoctonia solani AG-1 IA]|uniref:Uncharacterized protein n=1 Tax=Thanatephorus cucumeris (strain AG1-IA) TaxID=983506 RepID=L8WBE8_THACA|nr:hypothetical protein AG1IA_10479 [Rhizoctonia solani AG-1 IA]